MTATTWSGHLLGPGTHASLPSAGSVPDGALYVCTTHSKIYKVVSAAWTDYATLGASTTVATDTIWDTKGDLAVATGADAASKLAVGTDGQVLTADSTQTTGVKWAAGGGGGAWTQLYNLVRATDGTFDQASISGSYNDLLIQLITQSDRGGGNTIDQVMLRFNNDSTAGRYGWEQIEAAGTGATTQTQGTSTTQIQVGQTTAVGLASQFGMHEILIPGYSSTTWWKTIIAHGMYPFGVTNGAILPEVNGGIWNQTTAINRIQVYPALGTNWKTNSVCRIYGRT